MESIFFQLFETATPTTTALVVSGEPGTAKSMRLKRFQAVMSPNLVVNSGNKTARAGMQGNNDAHNGCLAYTDEMIAALEEADGGEEIEFYKQSCTERNITYQKAMPVKTSDGLEGHITASFKTWRWGVLTICTNRGGGFSKGTEEPSKVKQAMINRSQAIHVRKHDGVARPPDEFEMHHAKPEVMLRRTVIRVMTNLSLLVRYMLLFQPHLRPDMTIAQDQWREYDKHLVEKFGLNGLERRRNDKRTEDCVTACIWEAVWKVFGYLQTSVLCPSVSKRDDTGHLPSFHPSQLYEVIRILQPSDEIILDAWTRNLELSVSTSMTGNNVMSILAEAHHFNFTDLLCRSLDETGKLNVRDHVKPNSPEGERLAKVPTAQETEAAKAATDAMEEDEGGETAAMQDGEAGALRQPAQNEQRNNAEHPSQGGREVGGYQQPRYTRQSLFKLYPSSGTSGCPDPKAALPNLKEIQNATKRLRVRREATAKFRKQCLAMPADRQKSSDVEQMVTGSRQRELPGVGKTPRRPQAAPTMDREFSCIAPDLLMVSIFYSPTALLHWSLNEFVGPGDTPGFDRQNVVSGTHPGRHYVQNGKAADNKTVTRL